MKLDKLKSTLLISGLQQRDPVLYQIINTIIGSLSSLLLEANNGTLSGGGSSSDEVYLTGANASADLPNSRELLEGDGIEFNDSVANERTVNNLLQPLTIITEDDESVQLPNSRMLVAGDGISFDVSMANEIEINSDNPVSVQWSVLTNGDVTNPELIFAGGDVIMGHIP